MNNKNLSAEDVYGEGQDRGCQDCLKADGI